MSCLINPFMAAPSVDTLWSNVILLVHGEGADGSTAFTDRSTVGRALTATGDAQADTGVSVYGESILFDGTGDYISIPDAADIRLDGASGAAGHDFCLEAWINLSALAHTATFLSKVTSGNTGYRFYIDTTGKLQIRFLAAGSSKLVVSGATAVSLSTLTHIAFTRESGTGKVWLNGTLDGSAAQTANPTTGNNAVCGMGYDIRSAGLGIQGSCNWFRLTRSNARYTANFIPPTPPYPTS